MNDKIEEILGRHERDDVFGITQELLHLIQEERKDAVEGLLNKCCKECRDLVYSEYALQEQDKKTNGVEKMVREEQGK